MRSLVSIPALIVLSLSFLVGCGGDDEESDGADEPGAGETSELVEAETRRCRTEVTITGAVERAWSGQGEVRRSGSETAVYSSQHDDASISAFSEIGDSSATANVTVDGQTYMTPLGVDTGLEIAGDGTGAEIDADAIGIEGPGVHIDATFECAEKAGQGGRGRDRGGAGGS